MTVAELIQALMAVPNPDKVPVYVAAGPLMPRDDCTVTHFNLPDGVSQIVGVMDSEAAHKFTLFMKHHGAREAHDGPAIIMPAAPGVN